MGKSATLVGRWSGHDGWPERAGAWDAEVDRRRREEFAAAAVDASREQAETAALIRLGVDAFARSFLDELAAYRERGEHPFDRETCSRGVATTSGRSISPEATSTSPVSSASESTT